MSTDFDAFELPEAEKAAARLDQRSRRRQDLARQAAIIYYLENQTMESVCRRLGVSRSTVSRLLAYARETGIVTIKVSTPRAPHSRLTRELYRRFGVGAQVVDLPQTTPTHRLLEVVGKLAAQRIDQLVSDGEVIGIAWGNTTSEVVQHLSKQPVEEVTVVQLNGAASTETSGIAHAGAILHRVAIQLNANVIQFPVPAFFDDPLTKQALWREGAVKRVLKWQKRCTMAIFGVGALRAEMPSHVYQAGYLTPGELRRLERDGVVGDVCTVLLRQDGSWKDIAINNRATGPTPLELAQIPRRVCVVAGKAKAAALAGALAARIPTELICDKEVALRALEILSDPTQRHL